jgi:hypothetical protein
MLSGREDFKYYDDFELCSLTVKEILKKHKHPILATDLSEEERVILLVWSVTGIIENGGFHYLFESELPGDPEYRLTVEAFKLIGCEEAMQAIEQALCLFSNCKPPLDENARINQYENCSKEIRDIINDKFIRAIDDATARLADYIRKRRF